MKNVLGFLIGALLTTGVLWLVWPESNVKKNTTWPELSGKKLERAISKASQAEVQEFASITLHEALPANYVYQPHVVNAPDVNQANAAVRRNYPEFAVNTREEYYNAIRKNPEQFRKYAYEMNSVRLFFAQRKKPVQTNTQLPDSARNTRR